MDISAWVSADVGEAGMCLVCLTPDKVIGSGSPAAPSSPLPQSSRRYAVLGETVPLVPQIQAVSPRVFIGGEIRSFN